MGEEKRMNEGGEKTAMEKKQKQKQMEYEFCKVCRRNHDQGRGHIYFPSHKKSLSAFLSRFSSKLSDIRFFLKNPSRLAPEHAHLNGLWCVFCDVEISELQSSSVCENSIRHLAGGDHLNNVRDFLRKYGGGMDKVDSLRVSDSDLLQWEKKCSLFCNAVSPSSGGSFSHLSGTSKDIHYKLNSVTMDRFEKNSYLCFKSSFSNSVVPLQYSTNESNQVSLPDAKVAHSATIPDNSHLLSWRGAHKSMDTTNLNNTKTKSNHAVCMENRNSFLGNYSERSVTFSHEDSKVQQKDSGKSKIQGQVSEEPTANVHSGGAPPWLQSGEESGTVLGTTKDLNISSTISHSHQPQKSRKLNPKRVGAAWAERRRIELEREKRGEILASDCDDNWLPNFGRVWHAGTRKESRKEFEMEKQNFSELENSSESSFVIQPYESKRMRKNAEEIDGTDMFS